MIRPFAFLLAVLCVAPVLAPAAALSQGASVRVSAGVAPGDALARALADARAKDWAGARAQAAASGIPLDGDIIKWFRLRAGAGAGASANAGAGTGAITWRLSDYVGFLARHRDWPGLPYLRRTGEATLAGEPAAAVLAYFAGHTPKTGTGALRLADAYRALGRNGDAKAELVRAWRSLSLTRPEEDEFVSRFSKLLAPHNWARLDMLLWRGRKGEAQRLLARVSQSRAKLAKARLALRKNRKRGINALIAAVPRKLASDPGLAFERFLWRIRNGKTDAAIALLRSRSRSAAALGRPAAWANLRRSLARSAMRAGKGPLAYVLASRHFLTRGAAYADLEWLSGFIALRELHKPALAERHFARFRAAVTTPISLGRAGYWCGRAWEAMGKKAKAKAAYAFAARYQTSFYGQLAAERGGISTDPALAGGETFPNWRTADFMSSSVLKAGLLLLKAGELKLAGRFFAHLSESLDRTETGRLSALALALDQPYVALMIAKRAARQSDVIVPGYYPLTDLARRNLPVPAELALAIARRESEFDRSVVSPVGARGLMQLMPRTARAMARKTGQSYSRDRLLADPEYNASLATAYLAQLTETFGGNYLLVAAAYNAGPPRLRQWLAASGDPRTPGVDAVDWIEKIPYRETRNYVMRVMESLAVYRARLSGKIAPLHLAEALKRR